MDMYQSEKNLLEKLADAIPGLKGYRDKESRRDTDKRFREYLANRIDTSSDAIDDIKRRQVNEKRLDGLADWDRLSQKLFKVSNSIRHATYGYSGFFDQVKIQEAELDRLYQYDLSLVADVEALEKSLQATPQLSDIESKVNALERRVEDRKNLFSAA
jgi:hypothetical protein